MRKEYDFSNGKRGAVIPSTGKTRITIMLDDEVIEFFRTRAEALGCGIPDHDQHGTARRGCRCGEQSGRRQAGYRGHSSPGAARRVAHIIAVWLGNACRFFAAERCRSARRVSARGQDWLSRPEWHAAPAVESVWTTRRSGAARRPQAADCVIGPGGSRPALCGVTICICRIPFKPPIPSRDNLVLLLHP
jgi:hypothetical protein